MTAGEHKKTETNWENVFTNERERERKKKEDFGLTSLDMHAFFGDFKKHKQKSTDIQTPSWH